jgi:hypothetical protein
MYSIFESFVRGGHSFNRALDQPGSKIRNNQKNIKTYQNIKKHYYSLLKNITNTTHHNTSEATIITGQICIDYNRVKR